MAGGAKQYLVNIMEAVTTIATGMWITFRTAFGERKVTVQYPSYDVLAGKARDALWPRESRTGRLWEPLLGASQHYRGPLLPKVADRFRGMLGYEEPKCIACLMCARICPLGVIEVDGVKTGERKTKMAVNFKVDYRLCMLCGLCVEVCPTQAVVFTHRFEGAVFDHSALHVEFISQELRLERMAQAAEFKKAAADKKAAAEAAKQDPPLTEDP